MAEHSLREVKKKFQRQGIYHTDNRLAEMMREYLPDTVRNVYDPTCGRGALLSVFPDDVPKYGQELEADFIADCMAKLKNFTGVVGDTLKEPAFMGRRFHAVVANYPFSQPWEPDETDPRFTAAPTVPTKSKADYAYILHCLHYLADDGTAVIMGFPGILYRMAREGQIREWLVRENLVDRVIHIPGGYFEDTDISVCILILKKNRPAEDTAVIFEDREIGACRKVSRNEIALNNYVLSTNIYMGDVVSPKPKVDPAALEIAARRGTVTALRRSIIFSSMLKEIDDTLPPVEEFLNDLEAVIYEFKKGGEFLGR